MDVLADVLERTRARGCVFARSVLHAPWGFGFEAERGVRFHLVLEGGCWLRGDGHDPLRLDAGDMVFVTAEGAYELADEKDGATVPFEPLLCGVRERRSLEWPGPGPVTRLVCGAYRFDHDGPLPMLRELPPLLLVRAGESRRHAGLRSTLAMLAAEVERREPGSRTIADRLVDVLLVQVLRVWLEREKGEAPGWASALRDAEVARALELIHRRPAEHWTLEALGREVGLSRSAFARRFTAAVGEPAMAYLGRWRMAVAAQLLRDTELPVTAVAHRVGYDSAFAFSIAFKRATGRSPSAHRARRPAASIAARRPLEAPSVSRSR
jgi:AraC-like DNA-binding protein